ncbi:MAG TPA: response regulator [Candidatus Saccharimonadales bacterium]|nr:response regulator [Candidatus Saccharimonadales bacterium]
MAGSKTILIIEDDRFISEMYARSLRHAGYAVDVAVTGQDGINAALQKRYDVILLDIMLPEKQGKEVLQELKSYNAPTLTDTRIIIMTNFDQDELSRSLMQSQADGYLIKADITPRKLVDIINSLFTAPPAAPTPAPSQ